MVDRYIEEHSKIAKTSFPTFGSFSLLGTGKDDHSLSKKRLVRLQFFWVTKLTNQSHLFRLMTIDSELAGGFNCSFISTPTWGNYPIRLIFFKWVETTN